MTGHRWRRAVASGLAALTCCALAACATSRSEIRLPAAPTSVVPASAATGPSVFIRSIEDARVFEQEPANPSTPSLGSGGIDKATAGIRARAVGRKRSKYGMALGDVLLENDQTVVGVVKNSLVAAFQQAGCKVVDRAGSSTVTIDVRIDRFWVWYRPHVGSKTLQADIATDLLIAGRARPLAISIHAQDKRQMPRDGDWRSILDEALYEYRAEIARQAGSIR